MKRVYRAVDVNGTKIAPDMDNYFQMIGFIHGHPDRELVAVWKDWSTEVKPTYEINFFKFTEVRK